ncbi:MAG TPA: STAS domain-containing protein [Candidatus Sulfotelmatobacter sp.]|nr:STAS domain-containing protein [Candidatus Sulfotelmatobacter sp.]
MTQIDEVLERPETAAPPEPRTDTAAPPRLRLARLLDTSAAGTLQRELRLLVGDPPSLVLEADHVERASTASIQVLLAAEAALAPHGGRLMLVDPTPSLCEALVDLGLEDELERWRVTP